MKIQNSSITLAGESTYTQSYKLEASLQSTGVNIAPILVPNEDILDLSSSTKEVQTPTFQVAETPETQELNLGLSEKDKQKIALLEAFLEAITGKKIKFRIPEKLFHQDSGNFALKLTPVAPNQMQFVSFKVHQEYVEQETMSFVAQGKVTTADGKTISLDLQLNMSRSFAYSSSIEFQAGQTNRIDPLTINLDVSSATLTQRKFVFDLDCDGTPDQISFLAPGSGFLALDKNGDGIINDGSELFGTQSGDGFADLALYDSDHNGWIDENDPIFHQLRIWTKNEKGEDVLFALGEKGVGALYLGNVATNFSLKDAGNQAHGEIRKTGIYLREDGTAGTLQHVDLVV